MKKSLLLIATVFLLVGCTSKKDTCAEFESSQITMAEAAKKLRINPINISSYEKVKYRDIMQFCSYYKN